MTIVLQETIGEARVLLKQAIDTTLDGLLDSKLPGIDAPTNGATVVVPTASATSGPTSETVPTVPPTQAVCLGCAESNPANSCLDIARAGSSSSSSGFYWLRTSGGISRVYCDMSTRFNNTAGWMRVANLDMTDPSQTCPGGLRLVSTPRRTCGRSISSPGCSSAFFSTQGVSYCRVCGRVIGYQYSSPNAFFAYQHDQGITINDYYVDGVSLTRGSPRQHIWSFAATLDETNRDRHICPCSNQDHSLPSTALPPFIGNDYFCDSGTARYQPNVFHSSDPLWDGQGCGGSSSCCSFNSPPWFCKDLNVATTDDVEMRICGNENTSNEDTPVEIVELYVQ